MTDIEIEHDVLNEQIVIAAALSDAATMTDLVRRIRAETFTDSDHVEAWKAIVRCSNQGLDPTPETVASLSGGKVDRAYLAELRRTITETSNVGHHAETLLWDAAKLRAAEGPLNELLKAIKDPTATPERVRALGRQVSVAFDGAGQRQFAFEPDHLVKLVSDGLKSRRTGIACYSLGIPGLDSYPEGYVDDKGRDIGGQPLLVPGSSPGKVTVVTAISGGGKSTIVGLMALGMRRAKRTLLYGAWEQGSVDTLELMATASVSERKDPTLTRAAVRTGSLSDGQQQLVEEAAAKIVAGCKFFDLPTHKARGVRHGVDETLDAIHGYIADSGCEVAIFDLWSRAFPDMTPGEEAVALYRMQAIAEETQCHVILVQQQRLKDIETRLNPCPTREGIKGSAAWVEVPDTILGVYLPGLTKRVTHSTIEIHILKQRYGRWPFAIEFDWDGDRALLSDPRIVDYRAGDANGGKPHKPEGAASKFLSAGGTE